VDQAPARAINASPALTTRARRRGTLCRVRREPEATRGGGRSQIPRKEGLSGRTRQAAQRRGAPSQGEVRVEAPVPAFQRLLPMAWVSQAAGGRRKSRRG